MLPRLAVLLGLAACAWAQTAVYLGVLESGRPHVHIAFEYRNGRWQPLPQSYPEGLRLLWTVASNGRRLGEMRTGGRSLIAILPPGVPEVVDEFPAWMGKPPFHLILLSSPNFHDPDQWKPFPPPPGLLDEARAAFIQLKAPATCQGEPVQTQPQRDLRLVHKAYRSAKGSLLVALEFDAPKDIGDDVLCETIWLFREDGQFHYIGAGLTFLDAGDYDDDGHSEVIFSKSGYNLDGYVLLSTRDASTQSFVWTYH